MRPLYTGFERSLAQFASRPALEAAGQTLTYAELGERAGAIAAAIQREAAPGPPLVAVLADRTPTAFAGVLGALLAGRGYVPLNPTFPVERTRAMLERSGARIVVCDAAGAACLPAVLGGLEARTVVLAGDVALSDALPGHRIVGPGDLPSLSIAVRRTPIRRRSPI